MNKWVYQIEDIGLDNEQCLLNETVFHNANGYIGVRSDFEEGYAQGYDTIRGLISTDSMILPKCLRPKSSADWLRKSRQC